MTSDGGLSPRLVMIDGLPTYAIIFGLRHRSAIFTALGGAVMVLVAGGMAVISADDGVSGAIRAVVAALGAMLVAPLVVPWARAVVRPDRWFVAITQDALIVRLPTSGATVPWRAVAGATTVRMHHNRVISVRLARGSNIPIKPAWLRRANQMIGRGGTLWIVARSVEDADRLVVAIQQHRAFG